MQRQKDEFSPLIPNPIYPSAPPGPGIAPTAVVVDAFEMKQFSGKPSAQFDNDDSSDEEGDPNVMSNILSREAANRIRNANIRGSNMVLDEKQASKAATAQGIEDANYNNRKIETSNQRIKEGGGFKVKIKSKVANSTYGEDIVLLNEIDSKEDINKAGTAYVGDVSKPLEEDINKAGEDFLHGKKSSGGGYKISEYKSEFDIKDVECSFQPKGYSISEYKSPYD